MTLPALMSMGKCCPELTTASWVLPLATALDIILLITCLIVGILGMHSVIPAGPCASYALIGISCSIIILWSGMTLKLISPKLHEEQG